MTRKENKANEMSKTEKNISQGFSEMPEEWSLLWGTFETPNIV